MLQKTVCETFRTSEPVRPVPARNGTVFYTICHTCNTKILSKYDPAVGDVVKKFKNKIDDYLKGRSYSNIIQVPVDALSYSKSMVGHILAATSQKDCMQPTVDSNFYTPLRNFILNDRDISSTHDIYYWFYPHRMNITAQSVAFKNGPYISINSLLYFFPIAFMITLKGTGIYPKHASKLDINQRTLIFNMTTENIESTTFPFIRLEGDQLFALDSGLTCVSYSLKN